MLRRMIEWWKQRRLVRRITHARRLAASWERRAKRLLKQLERTESRMVVARQKMEGWWEKAEVQLAEANRMIEQHEQALESLRNENEILTETVVPQLTAANRMHLERWNAEVAVQVRRQVALAPEGDR